MSAAGGMLGGVRCLVLLAALAACKPVAAARPVEPGVASVEPAVTRGEPAPSTVAVAAAAAGPPDRDGDGSPDGDDRCPDEPEDRDEFEDEDGCVDRDNDGDGILDGHEFKDGRWTSCDWKLEGDVEIDCRNLPEDFDALQDHDGCPDTARVEPCNFRVPERVHFDRRGRLAADTPGVLDRVARSLKAAPDIELWVDANVDHRPDREAARALTQQIADEVVVGLVARGVARERLEPRGFGDKYAGRDRSEAGRAADRRVELTAQPCGQWATKQSQECR